MPIWNNGKVDELVSAVLHEAKNRAPKVPAPTEAALDLCIASPVLLPKTRDWLLVELISISNDPDTVKEWSDPLKMAILLAANRQVRTSTPEAREAWERLLGTPGFGHVALFALGSTVKQRIDLMKTWWEGLADHKGTHADTFSFLGAAINDGLINQEEEETIDHLKLRGKEWGIELRMLVNEYLQFYGKKPIFPPVPVEA